MGASSEHIPEDIQLKKTVGRMATYLQGYPELMARTNNWDPAALEHFLADDMVANFQGAIDQVATTDQLDHIAGLIPDEWLAPAATGSPAQCVADFPVPSLSPAEQRTKTDDARLAIQQQLAA